MNVLLLGAAAACAVVGCGDSTGPNRTPEVQNALVFERANGSIISFPATTFVWCGPWEEGEVPTQAVHVIVGGPQSSWMLTAVRADVTVGQPLTFPNTFIWNEPKGADMFILDPPNELSTQSSDSSGQIVFQKLNCAPGGEVQFTVDAVVGSELGDLPPVRVRGSFSGPVGTAPQ